MDNAYTVIRDSGHWVIDSSLAEASARFKRLTGKSPSKKASILTFIGETKLLDEISISDLGDIVYNKNLIKEVIQ